MDNGKIEETRAERNARLAAHAKELGLDEVIMNQVAQDVHESIRQGNCWCETEILIRYAQLVKDKEQASEARNISI